MERKPGVIYDSNGAAREIKRVFGVKQILDDDPISEFEMRTVESDRTLADGTPLRQVIDVTRLG